MAENKQFRHKIRAELYGYYSANSSANFVNTVFPGWFWQSESKRGKNTGGFMPSDSLDRLREANLEKGKKFKKFILRSFWWCLAILIIAIVIAVASTYKIRVPGGLLIFAMVLIPICLLICLPGEKCPNCAAFGGISTDSELLGETYLGKKYRKGSDAFTALGNKVVKDSVSAVFKRTYDNHHKCYYCEYQWTERTTRTEEETI